MENNQSGGNVTSYTVEYHKEDGIRVKDVLNLPQAEYENLKKQYPAEYHRERKHKPFYPEDIQKLAKIGEESASACSVNTDSFEKSVAILMSLAEAIWKAAQKYKSFRMELFYNAKTSKTNYCIFGSAGQSVSESFQGERDKGE